MGKQTKNSKSHKIVILVGESSSGKSTIASYMCDNYPYENIVTYTTRPPRDNEVDGVDYNFVSQEDFQEMIDNNQVIEYRTYNTVFGKWYYGSSDKAINLDKKDYIIVLTPDGAESFINHFGKENCIVFYIYAPVKVREQRAKERPNFDKAEWERRCITDREDFREDKIAHVAKFKITNDKPIEVIAKSIQRYVNIWKA